MNNLTVTDARNRQRRWVRQLGLDDFLSWWLGELSAALRAFLPRQPGAALEQWTLVGISGSLVTFSRLSLGQIAETGRLDMSALDAAAQKQAFRSELGRNTRAHGAVALHLPRDQVLRKKLFLPLAAEENLRQVLEFEMDRHTPFKASQVYFDYRVVRKDKQLEIVLTVAPRETIDEPLRRLAAWDVRPGAVLAGGDAADDSPCNLLPEGLRNKGGARRPYLNIALAISLTALLCVALALPILQKREAVLALQPLVAKARAQAESAETLRRQLEALLAEYNYLHDKKRASPPVVAVLEDVSRVLPDDTWVQQFELKGKEMKIQGETASSSKLVSLFEGAKTLHDASFRAPLTKGQDPASERFQLAAETRALPRAETGDGAAAPTPPQSPAQPAPAPAGPPGDAPGTPAAQEKAKESPTPAIPPITKVGNKPAADTGTEKQP